MAQSAVDILKTGELARGGQEFGRPVKRVVECRAQRCEPVVQVERLVVDVHGPPLPFPFGALLPLFGLLTVEVVVCESERGGVIGATVWAEARVESWEQTGVHPAVAVWTADPLAEFFGSVNDDPLFALLVAGRPAGAAPG